MSLLDLPPEILELIASKIDSQSALCALIRTNRYLYQSFHLYLYSNQILVDKASKVLDYATQNGCARKRVYPQLEEYILTAAVWIQENPERQWRDPSMRWKKSQVQDKSRACFPSLACAAVKGNEDGVKFLLGLKEKGLGMIKSIDVNVRDPANRTPLSYAAEQGHVNIVRLLLNAGADPNVQDSNFGRTPLHWAGSPRLTGRAPVEPCENHVNGDMDRWRPEFCSVETYFKEDVPGFGPWNDQREKESDFIFDIENQNFSASFASLPAPWADTKAYEQIVDLLIKHGANIEITDCERRSPLCWAAACGYTSFVEILLNRGAEFRYPEVPGLRDPVSWAAEHGHTAIIKLLIRSGASATASSLGGGTCPMTLAAMNGYDETLILLAEQFYYREFFGRLNIYTGPLIWAARRGRSTTVQILIDLCTRYYHTMPIHSTALFWASYHGHAEVVQILLEAGVSAEVVSKWDGMTSLQVAVMNRHVRTVKVLLESGNCRVNAVDSHGWSAFSWVTKDREMAHVYRWGQPDTVESPRVKKVCEKDLESYKKIRDLLFEHGADQSCQAIKKLLLRHGADPTFKKPKSKSSEPPHSILKISRSREQFALGTIPVSIR